MPATRIGVVTPRAFETHARLFAGLAELTGVAFVPVGSNDRREHLDGAIVLDASVDEAIQIARSGVRTLHLTSAASSGHMTAITFSQSPALPVPLRGATLGNARAEPTGLVPTAGDEVMARSGDTVLWTRRAEGASSLDLVAAAAPAVPPAGFLFALVEEGAWFSLVTLIQFARHIAGWSLPPSRACFMFDDPNLHWKTYGHVNYEDIACDAELHNYHVSFATVPMDGWYIHRPTAELFRKHVARMSFLIHGNNHTHLELHRDSSAKSQTALAAQALQRVARTEAASGLTVSRVMAAPHGACSAEMARALVRVGFEAACISRGSLMTRNPALRWPAAVGLQPAECLGDGLPIIPRFGMGATTELQVRLALFLGQPVIPMGHHEDVRHGLEPLRRIAALVNSVGGVNWIDMASIARSNYLSCVRSDVMHVRTYARRIEVTVPAGVRRLAIERPWLAAEESERLSVRPSPRIDGSLDDTSEPWPRPVSPGARIAIDSVHPEAVVPQQIRGERTTVSAIIRRQLCEARDRFRPVFERRHEASHS